MAAERTIMVKVLPLLVTPYAKTVPFIPLSVLRTTRAAARSYTCVNNHTPVRVMKSNTCCPPITSATTVRMATPGHSAVPALCIEEKRRYALTLGAT